MDHRLDGGVPDMHQLVILTYPGCGTSVDHQTTQYTYDGDDHVLTMKAVDVNGSGTSNQITGYVYNSTTNIFSNDLLTAVQYPDKTTGNASSSEQETFIYDALGERTTYTDRNGSVHDYSYDVLGRLTTDNVSTLGSGVDGSVRKLGYTFNTQGLPEKFTSYDASGTVMNEVLRQYNGLGQLTTESQGHIGAVATSTSSTVQYAYSEMAGGANHSRLTSMTYPNGRVITYDYGTANGLNDAISRLTALKDGSTTFEGYAYLGLSTVVKRARPEDGVDLTYINAITTGSAGDKYVGLDSFGRVVDQKWANAIGTVSDEFKYGYTRDSDRPYRTNELNHSFDELYSYDGLNRLTSMKRGTLSSGNTVVSAPTHQQQWRLDALGNTFILTTDGTSVFNGFNLQNQIAYTSEGYDANGNDRNPGGNGALVYDAWNRLVQAPVGAGGDEVLYGMNYAYDALGRRIRESSYGNLDGSEGTPLSHEVTTDHYYSDRWQVVQSVTNGINVSGNVGYPLPIVTATYVWSPGYVDELVERDVSRVAASGFPLYRVTNAAPYIAKSLEDAPSGRVYAQQDANYNVTSLIGDTDTGTSGYQWGAVERYAYDAYGQPTFLTSTFTAVSGNTSAYAMSPLFQGTMFDANARVYHVRYRVLKDGRWAQQDPLGDVDGNNLYDVNASNSINMLDPLGGSVTIVDVDGNSHMILPTADALEKALDHMKKGSIVKITIVGHGSIAHVVFLGDSDPHGVEHGQMDDSVDNLQTTAKGKRGRDIIDGKGRVITGKLKDALAPNATIALEACNSSGIAEDISVALPGVVVTGIQGDSKRMGDSTVAIDPRTTSKDGKTEISGWWDVLKFFLNPLNAFPNPEK